MILVEDKKFDALKQRKASVHVWVREMYEERQIKAKKKKGRYKHGWSAMVSLNSWKKQVKEIKTNLFAIYLACKDPRVPWYTFIHWGHVVSHKYMIMSVIE